MYFELPSARHAMAIRSIGLFVLAISISVTAISCRQSSTKDVAQERDCVPRVELANLRLLVAAWQGSVEEMDAMIKAGADVNTLDSLLGTPVVAAAESGNYKAVALLLDKGANVNATDNDGYTALMKASLKSKSDIVRLLISKGSDVNASCYPLINGKRTSKFTALLFARWKKNEEIVRLLTEAGAKE